MDQCKRWNGRPWFTAYPICPSRAQLWLSAWGCLHVGSPGPHALALLLWASPSEGWGKAREEFCELRSRDKIPDYPTLRIWVFILWSFILEKYFTVWNSSLITSSASQSLGFCQLLSRVSFQPHSPIWRESDLFWQLLRHSDCLWLRGFTMMCSVWISFYWFCLGFSGLVAFEGCWH